jgi:hypothetical protein
MGPTEAQKVSDQHDTLSDNTTTACGVVNNFAPWIEGFPLQLRTRSRSLWGWNVPESVDRSGV